jgi:hypothetical protein
MPNWARHVDDISRLLAERACEALILTASRLVDFGNASRLAELFVDDGVWEAEGLALTGREEIRAHFLRREGVTRRVSRHVCTNVAIDVLSDDEAEGLCYFLNFRHDRREGETSLPVPANLPKYSGEYRDRFRRTPVGWRFAHRKVDVTFLRPPTPPPPQ